MKFLYIRKIIDGGENELLPLACLEGEVARNECV
jgi:hypothetical protein